MSAVDKRTNATLSRLLEKVLPGSSSTAFAHASASSSGLTKIAKFNHNVKASSTNKSTLRKFKQSQRKKQLELARLVDMKESKKQAKINKMKNLSKLDSWSPHSADASANGVDLDDLQRNILSLKQAKYAASKPVSKKSRKNKNKITTFGSDKSSKKSWPGLTPGLAPVDYSESEDEADDN
ncbi:hypothetical protein NADFUDRAFT_83459 [Nadsonia fulvescens var. elongata DSM 6958]|uniref:Regulator of rDNA transcription 14 n=1 Tax=Nadsonia fulvescens var. elongata DSM 6958 TaxID=857566 RepID=A0A1E3PGW5_9ASCO|nr:hypothetical protein NADFUDRAFT_83459 [Nadsonia fulvescens var. elongata DSM 6958]